MRDPSALFCCCCAKRKSSTIRRVKRYWEIIADNLSKAQWIWGYGILLLLLTRLTAHAQNEFTWKDTSDETRNLSDLQEILRETPAGRWATVRTRVVKKFPKFIGIERRVIE